MTIQPNEYVTAAIITRLNALNKEVIAAENTRKAVIIAREKAVGDLAKNDQVFAALREEKDSLHAHLALVAPPLSDDEIAALENTPGVIE